jgi:uncharacterized membrane protein YwaF
MIATISICIATIFSSFIIRHSKETVGLFVSFLILFVFQAFCLFGSGKIFFQEMGAI